MTYLLKTRRGGDVTQAETIRVTYEEKTRPTGRTYLGGLREVESAGWDRKKLRIRPVVKAGGGVGGTDILGSSARAANTAEGVKTVLRRIRHQEAEGIAAVDKKIADLTRSLLATRQWRQRLVNEAFARGHVVRLKELPITEPKGDS